MVRPIDGHVMFGPTRTRAAADDIGTHCTPLDLMYSALYGPSCLETTQQGFVVDEGVATGVDAHAAVQRIGGVGAQCLDTRRWRVRHGPRRQAGLKHGSPGV